LQNGPVVRAHHVDLAGAAVGALDRLLRHRERVAVGALHDLDTHIHAGQQLTLRVGELAAQRDLAGAGIDARVREQQASGMRIERPVVEHEPHLGRIRLDLLELAALQIAPQLLQLAGGLGEVGVDGIELLHGGKMRRLALSDQCAFRHQRATDAAADR
jgi:hypothetical protein